MNRLFFYSAGNADVGGNYVPAVGNTITLNESAPVGGMFPIHVSYLRPGNFDGSDDQDNSNIPSWNPKDKLVINFKIQWG